MPNDELTDADVGVGSELSDSDVGIVPRDTAALKRSLASDMEKLRSERFLGEQAQALAGAGENIANVASIPAQPILKLPRSEGTGIGSGLLDLGAETLEGASAPAYWAIPGSGIVRSLAAGQALGSLMHSIPEAYNAWRNPNTTPAEKVLATARPIVAGGVGAGLAGVKLPVRETFPEVINPLEVAREASLPQKAEPKPPLIPKEEEALVQAELDKELGQEEAPPSVIAGEDKPSAAPVSEAVEAPVTAGATPQAMPEPSVTPSVTQGEVVSPVTPQPVGPGIPSGPGAAAVGDQPAAPRQAVAAAAPIERGPSSNRPFGAVSSISAGLNQAREAVSNIGTFLKGIAGESMPNTTKANRQVGEAGVRYASSRIAARPLARTFSAKALQGTDVDPVEFGAALTEDNLRSVRESLRQKATEALAEGKGDEAKFYADKADNVATIIGSKGSPFETEESYFDYLARPDVQQAVKQHIQMWQEVVDPQFREAMDIDPDTPLPTRGQQTGARVNLRAVFPEDPSANPVRGMVGSNLTGTFKRKTPFGIKAKGSGETYDINYNNLIENTFERQLEIANKNKFDDMLVASGNAVIDKPGRQVIIDGKPAVGFPLSRRVLVTTKGGQTQSFSQAQNIYVRQSLANEYESASGVGTKYRSNPFVKVANVLNRAALAGLTDATVHISNQMTALLDRPTSGKLLTDSLLSATGRADVPVTIVRAIIKAFQDNKEQTSQLAEIGAMRPQDIHYGLFGRALQATDKVTRLVLDDTFKSLVKEGLVENTETARREYVNQIGQYNRKLQGKFTRLARDTGLGPFVTAGKTFNALGVRMATLDPGAAGANVFAATALRANVLSKWVGGAVLLGTLNYLLTSKLKGGGVLGRPGTPVGNLDLGTNDKAGKQQSFPLFSVLGLGRGLRVTGLSGAINSKRLGLTNADAAESASRDIINAWSAPFAGPPVKFGAISTTGYSPAVEVGRTSRIVPPGDNQRLENVKEAVLQASPLVQTYIKYREGKSTPEVLSSQIPRFTMTPGKTEAMVDKYPKIVALAQGAAFIDDMIHQARKLPKEERRAFVREQILRLPPQQRQHAQSEANRRKVYTN